MDGQQIRYFPKQLFLRFVGGQLLLALPILLLASLASRFYLAKKIGSITNVEEILPAVNYAFLFLVSIVLLLFIGVSLWMGYRLILPLGRVIAKTRAILRKDYKRTEDIESELFSDNLEAGEWYQLESALNRIQSDMHLQDTSLARDREEIEAIISALSDAVIAVDKSGNILFYNSQFAVLFADRDFQKKATRLGELFRNPDVLAAFQQAIKMGKNIQTNTQLTIKNESTARHFSLSVAPIHQGTSDIYGVVGVFHDVTELKRIDEIRIDFVANVSHELRTPLTSIKGYTQTLKYDIADNNLEIAEKHIEIITRNVDRLIALVSDLLNLSSLESGGSSLELSSIDLKELTERVLLSLEEKRAEKEQNITSRFSANTLEADSRRVEQVMYNLVENAIKYAPKGKTIEIIWEKLNEKEICLHVLDDGPGIPPEHHPRLFERFYRVDKARTRDAGGTGLGLAIVKHIMQRHGGNIRVQGAIGKGTEFICTFPVNRK